jgi:hypothetical protein
MKQFQIKPQPVTGIAGVPARTERKARKIVVLETTARLRRGAGGDARDLSKA